MIVKKIYIEEILAFLGDKCISVKGDYTDVYIDNLADIYHINETTLDWVSPTKKNKQEIVEKSKAKVILVDNQIVYSEEILRQKKVLLFVRSPKMVLAEIGNNYFVKQKQPNIHFTAIIDSEANIGENVYIGPYSVIGKAKIGDNTVIDSNVRIHDNVVLGSHCNIKSGVVLGGEGFGFERDSNGNLFRFPQIGDLIIGNYVEIGANTCIDRGALSNTIIGDYSKINNLCHIAHNNIIGRNVEITGCVNISGGNIIDDNVWIAPNSSLVGYLHIGENSMIGMGAVVVKDVPSNEIWVGNPAKKIRDKIEK